MDEQKQIMHEIDIESKEEQAPFTPEEGEDGEFYVTVETRGETIRETVEEEHKKSNWFKELYEWTQSIAVAVVLALLINQFVFSMVVVDGGSMLPTLEHADRLVITKLFYEPEAKDIVVVKSRDLGKYIIKRVIAVPGDVIDIHSGTGDVIVNGEVLDEPYIQEKLRSGGTANAYPLTVPENHVFVMGDNRNNSLDSRSLGLVPYKDVVGRASLRIMPFSKIGTLYKNVEQ